MQPGETPSERLYQPEPGETQLTVRAVATGCIIGGLIAAMNMYLGLKIGITEGGSLLAAILSFGLFTAMNPTKPFSVLETNISQTAGSGAGSMPSAAGLLAPIPAMAMLGEPVPWYALFLWALSVAYLGVFFAVPLRRHYVVVEKLRFPTGTATANTIVAMYAKAGEALAQARALMFVGSIAAGYSIASYFVPYLENVPTAWTGSAAIATVVAWGFQPYIGPMMLGAGILVGPRVGISCLLGAIVAWGVLGPFAQSQGWAPGEIMSYKDGARGWILWCGAAIMVSEALMSLALSWRTFAAAFQRTPAGTGDEDDNLAEGVPNRWWMFGLLGASLVTIVIAQAAFDIQWWMTIMAIALSAILANVAVRSTGETDWNPIGGMGKVTQLVFGGVSPGATTTNLMAAGITGAGASQAGDMMHDLKAGYLLGASPRKQFIAQLLGIAAGVIFVVPLYYLFDAAFNVGAPDSDLPAPAAHAWKAVALVLSKGLSALPKNAEWAALGGAIFGATLPIIRKTIPKAAPYVPSGLGFGLAFLIPAPKYFVTMFIGSMFLVWWQRSKPEVCKRFMYPVACGLIAGEGLMGVVKAAFKVLGVSPLIGGGGH